jgi:hypothetical protein
MDGAERMLRVTAGRDIECPLMGDDAVPQHDNRNGEPHLHEHKVLLNRATATETRHRTTGCQETRTSDLNVKIGPHET